MLSESSIRDMLHRVSTGVMTIDDAVATLRRLPFEHSASATIDHHRALRHGFCEVVLCSHKTPAQVAEIFAKLAAEHEQVLGTRASRDHFEATLKTVPDAKYNEPACAIWLDRKPDRKRLPGVVIVAAGTADLPVAEEAAITLDLMGHCPHRIQDAGVAGLHRLLPHVGTLQAAHVIIAIAGMEGALPSVIGGLVGIPVIAVPTSVGYGASFGGIAALLAMLNSCASGVAVMNIDNGYGAAHLAASINRLAQKKKE